jgi:uncharacterized damage-inducible protein DinB
LTEDFYYYGKNNIIKFINEIRKCSFYNNSEYVPLYVKKRRVLIMSTAVLSDKIEVLTKSINDIVEVIIKTEESILYIKPSEIEWSAMQVVSHVLEAVDFWLEDLEALLIVPGAKWGRNHEHVRRLAAVDENVVAKLKKDEAIEALHSLIPRAEKTLTKVKEEDLEKTAPSYNPNFDGKSLAFLIDHLIVKHVEGHYDQIIRHLAKVQ